MSAVDRISGTRGTRTPHGPGDTWPAWGDPYPADGLTEDDVGSRVRSTTVLHGDADGRDTTSCPPRGGLAPGRRRLMSRPQTGVVLRPVATPQPLGRPGAGPADRRVCRRAALLTAGAGVRPQL